LGYYNSQGLYIKSDKYDEFVEEYGSEITSDLACWIMTSRPDEPDSDFDFLDDSKDSEPMVSQFKTVILGGKPYYYGLDENGDAEKIPYDISKPEYDGYIIVQDGENVYYGGNQEWLSDGEKDAFDMEKGDYACGVIATHDVIQYLNGRSGTLDPYHKTEYVSSIKKYHDALADDDKLFFSDHGFIWPWNACSVINENTDGDIDCGISISIDNNEVHKDYLYNSIKQSVIKGNPAILCASGLKTYKFNVNLDNASMIFISELEFYKFHYFTVTGLMEFKGDRYLKIQTWGEVRYVKFDELFDLNLGDVL